MGQNLVSVHLDASQWARVDVLLEELERVFEPAVVGLAPEHRQRLMKMGDASEPFCRKAFTAMRDHPAIVSPAVDLDKLARDFASHDALAERRMRFDRLLAKLDDTDVALGSDIMVASLKGYALLKLIGDGLGLDGLRRDLGRRFGRKRQRRGEAEPATR
jgi:hypothetical protein